MSRILYALCALLPLAACADAAGDAPVRPRPGAGAEGAYQGAAPQPECRELATAQAAFGDPGIWFAMVTGADGRMYEFRKCAETPPEPDIDLAGFAMREALAFSGLRYEESEGNPCYDLYDNGLGAEADTDWVRACRNPSPGLAAAELDAYLKNRKRPDLDRYRDRLGIPDAVVAETYTERGVTRYLAPPRGWQLWKYRKPGEIDARRAEDRFFPQSIAGAPKVTSYVATYITGSQCTVYNTADGRICEYCLVGGVLKKRCR